MTDMARQLLQELMGEFQDSGSKYTDSNICKDHLVDFCPHQLFVNTKADLGYQKSPDRGRLGYEGRSMIRKVRRAMDRVTAEADENLTNPFKEEKEEKAIILDERIKQALRQVQEHGESGRVEEALKLYLHTDSLKTDLKALKQRIDSVNPMFKNEKRLEVCDVCGAFLVPNDASKRLDAHKEGKQHQGYIKIQNALEEYKKEGGIVREGRTGSDYRRSEDRYGAGPHRRKYNDSGSRAGNRSRSRSRSPYSRCDKPRGYDDRSSNYRDSSSKRRRDNRYY
ncbi:hypothetical protein BX661DRAFT_200411 [Kickxella alabastrina]|uniref:uncharacterized protein n=1 Tax=Kickxella alabastrina TaxID=61397 RepID=UPI00221ED675|nr:uncharacterized protein BX661DRAFT_200411 [Kickxella alabastrina]KAI7822485.1 hypothetical protein BX661DRAFT_200411 [Kickxella alabastrina]